METKHTPRISPKQVAEMNATHGWFQFADARSAVSNAFANEAIERYERIRTAAPDLLAALELIVSDHEFCGDDWGSRRDAWIETARRAIAKAQGGTS